MNNKLEVIGIDHGWSMMKTIFRVFTGVKGFTSDVISYYEQKTFWSLCCYMVRSRKGIKMLINLINISYSSMKLLPYVDDKFAGYRNKAFRISDLP